MGEPKSVSKLDRGTQTAPFSSLEKDVNRSNLSSSGFIITQPIWGAFLAELCVSQSKVLLFGNFSQFAGETPFLFDSFWIVDITKFLFSVQNLY